MMMMVDVTFGGCLVPYTVSSKTKALWEIVIRELQLLSAVVRKHKLPVSS
jgi:hypothetical protein